MEDGDDTKEEPEGGIEPYKPTLLHVVGKSGTHYWLDNPEEPSEDFKKLVKALSRRATAK